MTASNAAIGWYVASVIMLAVLALSIVWIIKIEERNRYGADPVPTWEQAFAWILLVLSIILYFIFLALGSINHRRAQQLSDDIESSFSEMGTGYSYL